MYSTYAIHRFHPNLKEQCMSWMDSIFILKISNKDSVLDTGPTEIGKLSPTGFQGDD